MKHRLIIAVSILLVWFLFLGLKLKAYYTPPQESFYLARTYQEKAVVKDQLFGIYVKTVRIGHLKRYTMPTNTGHKIFEEGVMKMSFLGEKKEIQMSLFSDVDKNFRIRNFSFNLDSQGNRVSVTGQMQGTVLTLSMITENQKTVQTISFKEPPTIPSAIMPLLVKSGFDTAKVLRFPVFDPSAMTSYDAEIVLIGWEMVKLSGDEIRAFHVKTLFKGIEVHAWIDEGGDTVKEVSPIGLVVQREKIAREAAYEDIGFLASIETKGTIHDPRNISVLKLKIDTRKDLLEKLGSFYSVTDGVIEIRKGESLRRTYNPDAYRGPTPFITSNDLDMKAFLPQIIWPGFTETQKADAVLRWVHGNMKKIPTFSLPVAKDVFVKKAGDCNEHAVLFAALARAAGLPCAVVSGMVYAQGSFYYHAWNLIYLEGKWVEADSTFGQLPADATHLALAVGDISDAIDVMQFVKNIRLEIVDAR